MITKDAALEIAEDVVRSRDIGTGVSSIGLFDEFHRRPTFYAPIPIENIGSPTRGVGRLRLGGLRRIARRRVELECAGNSAGARTHGE